VATSTVRIPDRTRQTLADLSSETGESLQDIIAAAVEQYRRNRILEQANQAYAALKSDPEAWQKLLDERSEWDDTLADDLDDE
jgi:predicted DNA-binding protein